MASLGFLAYDIYIITDVKIVKANQEKDPNTINLPVFGTPREVGKLKSAVQLPSLAEPATSKIRLVMQPRNDQIPTGNQLTNGIGHFSYLDEN